MTGMILVTLIPLGILIVHLIKWVHTDATKYDTWKGCNIDHELFQDANNIINDDDIFYDCHEEVKTITRATHTR